MLFANEVFDVRRQKKTLDCRKVPLRLIVKKKLCITAKDRLVFLVSPAQILMKSILQCDRVPHLIHPLVQAAIIKRFQTFHMHQMKLVGVIHIFDLKTAYKSNKMLTFII